LCEFDLVVDGKAVFKDVIYAKVEDGKVVARDILGKLKEYRNYRIEEVDVNSTRLVLSTI
jgi:predicted RNA-binding protein